MGSGLVIICPNRAHSSSSGLNPLPRTAQREGLAWYCLFKSNVSSSRLIKQELSSILDQSPSQTSSIVSNCLSLERRAQEEHTNLHGPQLRADFNPRYYQKRKEGGHVGRRSSDGIGEFSLDPFFVPFPV